MTRYYSWMISLALVACGGGDDADSTDDTTDTTAPADTTDTTDPSDTTDPADTTDTTDPSDTTDTPADTTDTTDTTPPDPWTITRHTCSAVNRTDALWLDDDGTIWVGCGSDTTGLGLFFSDDGGATFDAPATTPRNFFSTWRVLSVSRSADGFLYVAGTNTANANQMVVRIEGGGTVAEVYTAPARPQVGQKFTAGGFRRASDGHAMIESLTGSDTLSRAADGDAWTGGSAYTDGSTHQILDLTLDGDRFVAAGSTISEPPLYYAPANDPTRPVAFNIVQLESGLGQYQGEMWAVAADDGHVLVGGVDQGQDVGRFYFARRDGTSIQGFYADAEANRTNPTWVRGACMRDGQMAIVGEEQVANGEGFVLYSTDGASWTDITPGGSIPGAFSRCAFGADGALYVAGADNFMGVYRP